MLASIAVATTAMSRMREIGALVKPELSISSEKQLLLNDESTGQGRISRLNLPQGHAARGSVFAVVEKGGGLAKRRPIVWIVSMTSGQRNMTVSRLSRAFITGHASNDKIHVKHTS